MLRMNETTLLPATTPVVRQWLSGRQAAEQVVPTKQRWDRAPRDKTDELRSADARMSVSSEPVTERLGALTSGGTLVYPWRCYSFLQRHCREPTVAESTEPEIEP